LTLLLTIGLGIGSQASVAGFVRGLLTRDQPVHDIVSIFGRDAQDGFGPLSYESYLALRGHRETFERLGAVREAPASLALGGRPSVLSVAAMTPEVAELFALEARDGVLVSHRISRSELTLVPTLATKPSASMASIVVSRAWRPSGWKGSFSVALSTSGCRSTTDPSSHPIGAAVCSGCSAGCGRVSQSAMRAPR
jgi:hypothetical protein